MSDKYPGVIDVGGAMWAATTAPSRLPNTHKVVPLDAIVIDPSSLPPGGGPAEWAEWSEVTTDLKAVSTSHAEAVALARQAVEIGKAGGISDEKLAAVLHLAATGMTAQAVQRLRAAGIDVEPSSQSGAGEFPDDIPSPLWNAIDGFPRVMRMTPDSHGSPRFEGYFNGAYKVVPADAIVSLPSERRSLPQVCDELGVKVVAADAVVIEVSALPHVRSERGMQRFEAGASYADWDDDPEYFEERAREYVALAARLRQERERPVANDSQVRALASLIARDWAEHTGIDASAPDSIARRLVEQGWTKPGVES